MSLVLKSESCQQTREIGERLGKNLSAKDILALSGELGAGKTELVKGIARGLGFKDEALVASPTYVLIREYQGRLWLYHFDLYRLKSVRELEGIGYEEYFDGDGVSVVEWADKFPAIFPKRTLWIKLSIAGENRRGLEISTEKPALWDARINSLAG
jgi:tRNA threonylcarbamoyladenosine biosynthesis protein TsaE